MEDRFGYSIPEACADLGNMGRTAFYDIVKAGDLEIVKVGRKSIVTGRSMKRFKAKLLDQLAA